MIRSIVFRSVFFGTMLLLVGQGCIGSSENVTSGPAGVFLSSDKGEEWRSVSTHPTEQGVEQLTGVSVHKIVSDPHDSSAYYWLSRVSGMFFSTDNTRTWQRSPEPLNTGAVHDLAIHPTDRCTMYATNGTHLFKSEDCARSWEEVYRESRSGVAIRTLAFNPFPPFQLFMGESNGDLLRSNDLGVSWTVVRRLNNAIADILPDPKETGRIYAATQSKGLYRSDDAGRTWRSLEQSLGDFSGSLEYRGIALHPDNPGHIYWISTYGILISTDRGESWGSMRLITPPGSVQIYSFAINPKNANEIYYNATLNARSTLHRTIDGGENWITRRLPSGRIPTDMFIHPDNASWVYIGFTIPPSS